VVIGWTAAILAVGSSMASEPVWMCWQMGGIKFLIDMLVTGRTAEPVWIRR
jgi:hypothetical protein